MPTAASRRISAGRVLDVDEVELEILPRRDVRDAVRILLGQLGHDFELCGIEAAERDLDALHAGRIPHRRDALGRLRRS